MLPCGGVADLPGGKECTQKSKVTTCREVTPDDTALLQVGVEAIEFVDDFPYLGSVITSSGRMDSEIGRRIAQSSRAFGAFRKPVFRDNDLHI